MKNLYILIILAIFNIFNNPLYTQSFAEFSNSIKEGNVKEITNKFDEKVEVTILETDSYTKSDASILIASFFSGNENIDYTAMHNGTANGDALYQIGELKKEEKTFRTFVYSKKVNGDYIIQEFRISRI